MLQYPSCQNHAFYRQIIIRWVYCSDPGVCVGGGGRGGGLSLVAWVGKHVRPKSEWNGTFFGAGWITQITPFGYQNRQKCEKRLYFSQKPAIKWCKRGYFSWHVTQKGLHFFNFGTTKLECFFRGAYAYPTKVWVRPHAPTHTHTLECSDWDVIKSNGTQLDGILRSWNLMMPLPVYDDNKLVQV